MNSFQRRTAAVVLAFALSVPAVAAPSRGDVTDRFRHFIQKIEKFLGSFTSNYGLPTPPIPDDKP